MVEPIEEAKKSLLSTSSPEGIQIAAKITPTRLANLLIRKGPLPIRHITNQLTLEVPSFDRLSLSKQRRLIMAAMEQTDPENNVVFEKIGWGQWAVRKVGSDLIVTEGTEGNLIKQESTSKEDSKSINVYELRNQPNLKLGWSKNHRRESISNKKPNLHNVKLPSEELAQGSAITSDSEEEEENEPMEESSSSSESEDDELFRFEDEENGTKKSPPIKFANRVPLKLSPPPNAGSRRKSSSSVSKNTNYNQRHQIFNRSRLNSLENLDNYIISSAKNSNGSFSSPPPPPPPANGALAALSGSPLSSWSSSNLSRSPDGLVSINISNNRRKSSFNESNIRSTLSASLPRLSNSNSHANYQLNSSNQSMEPSDTDEEDWATIGAESLRKRNERDENDTKAAAVALVDLMSV